MEGNNADEAMNHYLGIFKQGRILHISRFGDEMPDRAAMKRMMQAMFTMTKLDVAKLEAAFRG